MTFFGESFGISDSWLPDGSDASNYRWPMTGSGDTYTLTTSVGESFILGFYSNHNYISEDDSIGGLKWVFRAMGTGTLNLSDTHDDNWDALDPTTPFSAISSVNINSLDFIDYEVDATASMRNASLLGGFTMTGEMIELYITVASGSITFDQIRLQVEPVGGIVGHWSDWIPDPNPILMTVGATQWTSLFWPGASDWQIPPTNIPFENYNVGPDVQLYWWPDNWSHFHGIILQVGGGWKHPRLPTMPLAMSDGALVDGIDFIANPYRVEDDGWNEEYYQIGSEYVDYEDSLSKILGWNLGTMNHGASATASGHQVVLEVNRNVPIVPYNTRVIFPVRGSGTVIWTSSHSPMSEAFAGIPVDYDPGPDTESLGFFLHNGQLRENPPFLPSDAAFTAYSRWPRNTWPPGEIPGSWPEVRVSSPPYRYWIPKPGGIPPMRQRHRDDGLATDARQMKGSGSSLQSSIRRGGQVYY